MQLFLGALPIILRLFSKARGHLLLSNYSWNNLPEPSPHTKYMSACLRDHACMGSIYSQQTHEAPGHAVLTLRTAEPFMWGVAQAHAPQIFIHGMRDSYNSSNYCISCLLSTCTI